MSDSLSRLILRAQGRLPVAEPVLAPRYADASAGAAWGETISETFVEAQPAAPVMPGSRPAGVRTGVPITRGRTAPSQDATPGSLGSERSSVSEVALPAEHTEPSAAAAALPPQPRHSLPNQRPFGALTRQAEAVTSVDTDVVPAQVQARPQAVLRRQQLPPGAAPLSEPASRYEPVQVQAAKLPSSRRPPSGPIADSLRVEPTVAAAPEVRISIGRLEVHAATPPAAPAAPARPAASRRPTVSLADYLAERGRPG